MELALIKRMLVRRAFTALALGLLIQGPLLAVDFEKIIQTLKARPISGKCERTLARLQTRIERGWWKGVAHFPDQASIESALATGQLEPLRKIEGVRYSAKMAIQYARPKAFEALDLIAQNFRKTLDMKGLDPRKVDLIVTSMVRTLEYQRSLIAQEFPASSSSSHTQGFAFDISYSWLEEKEPDYAKALEEVLEDLRSRGLVNIVKERQQGVWHIGLSPLLVGSPSRK